MKRDLIGQYKILTGRVAVNLYEGLSLATEVGKYKEIPAVVVLEGDKDNPEINVDQIWQEPYIELEASKYFYDVNNITEEEVTLLLIDRHQWLVKGDGSASYKEPCITDLSYPTNLRGLILSVMKSVN